MLGQVGLLSIKLGICVIKIASLMGRGDTSYAGNYHAALGSILELCGNGWVREMHRS